MAGKNFKGLSLLFAVVLSTLACIQAGGAPAMDARPAMSEPTARRVFIVTESALGVVSATPIARINPTATQTILPTQTSASKVTISAVKGNLFIRRGPDMAFNPIGVLYKDTSAQVIGRDVLSKWAQIQIPNSDQTGWVSVQTSYSQIEGNLEDLPGFTTTEWPVPAYLLNCTHHRMYVLPAEVILPSSFEAPDNEVWIYPGTYTVYDIDVSGDPEVATITIKEGESIEIREDGLGEKRKCP